MLDNFTFFSIILMGIKDSGGDNFRIFIPFQRIPSVAFIFFWNCLLGWNCLFFFFHWLMLACTIQRDFSWAFLKRWLFLRLRIKIWKIFLFGGLFLFLLVSWIGVVFIFCILIFIGLILWRDQGILLFVIGEGIFMMRIRVIRWFLVRSEDLFLEIMDPMDAEYFRLILDKLLCKSFVLI